jgi:hypothetical protein
MDPWTEVARRYERLIRRFESRTPPEQATQKFFLSSQQGELTRFLTDHVVPLTSTFLRRPRFQQLATWSLQNLVVDSDSSTRRSVIDLQNAYQKFVKSLSELVQLKDVARLLAEYEEEPVVVEQTVRLEAGQSKCVSSRVEALPDVTLIPARLESILEAGPTAFFRAEDYFLTQQELITEPGGKTITNGILVPQLSARLEPLGDLIARTGLQRIESALAMLSGTRQKIFELSLSSRVRKSPKYTTVQSMEGALQQVWSNLRAHVFEDPWARLRDSCCTLVQVQAAFAASPSLDWLGNTLLSRMSDAKCLPVFLRGSQARELFDRIARSVSDLGSIYDPDEVQVGSLEEVIGMGGLVMIEQERRAYWNCDIVQLEKGHRNWDFLWLLAQRAKVRASVTESDVFPEQTVSISTMPTIRGRLAKVIPPSLDKLIEADKSQNRAYRLNLDADRIHLISASKAV